MTERNRLIIDTMYALWESGDLTAMMNCFSDDVVFAVTPPAPATFVGQGQGKPLLARRLAKFLSDHEVLDYRITSISVDGDWVDARVRYHYQHKKTGIDIDGSMRHMWLVLNGKIVRLDVMHDGPRLGAYFKLSAQLGGACAP